MSTINFSQVVQQMLAVSSKISDLIFSPGRPPQVELIGKLAPVQIPGMENLTPAHTAGIARALIGTNKGAEESLEKNGSADLSFSLPGLSRFRVNIFRQRGTHAIVMRVVPNEIPSFSDLGLPPVLKEIAELKNGIVLVTGPTGSGKSSTLAAIIDLINESKYYHIVTIEDPIEFMHRHKNSTVHQRELHADTPNFAYALRAALRQAPKVILVGEIRDLETIEVALEASETGHLVFSTLHTTDSAKTVERIIGMFPKSQEHIIRMRLAGAFRFILSQRLLPRASALGRVAAIEVLRSTARTRDYIEKGEREGKSLYDAMRDGNLEGMQVFDSEIEKMIRTGTVTMNDGLAFATNRQNLMLQLSDYGGGSINDFNPGNSQQSDLIS
ncbi:MAG TPA: PilT/PilU family type 4a pilus ATPase [Blastocatellia bacterium]|nr:PilT/PilU family type 4a pilus ATPase [Blastocatellia bacterium]